MLHNVDGNKAPFEEILRGAGEIPININTSSSMLFPSIMDSIEKRKVEAQKNGDTEELARLEKYYANLKPEDLLVEPPIKSADGSYKFCYLSRNNGVLMPDNVLTDKRQNLREALSSAGIEVVKVTDVSQIVTIVDWETRIPYLLDLQGIGYDLIVMSTTDYRYEEAVKLLERLGCPKTRFGGWWIDSWEDHEDPHTDLWRDLYGAVELDSPSFKDGPYVIPYGDPYNLERLIKDDNIPNETKYLDVRVIGPQDTCAVMDDPNRPYVFPMRDVLSLKYAGVPLTKDDLPNLSIVNIDNNTIFFIEGDITYHDGDEKFSLNIRLNPKNPPEGAMVFGHNYIRIIVEYNEPDTGRMSRGTAIALYVSGVITHRDIVAEVTSVVQDPDGTFTATANLVVKDLGENETLKPNWMQSGPSVQDLATGIQYKVTRLPPNETEVVSFSGLPSKEIIPKLTLFCTNPGQWSNYWARKIVMKEEG